MAERSDLNKQTQTFLNQYLIRSKLCGSTLLETDFKTTWATVASCLVCDTDAEAVGL